MGWSIGFQQRFASTLRLSNRLPYLALFGILHGMAEWGDVFIPIQRGYLSDRAVHWLSAMHALLIATSFLTLLLFGAFLIADSLPRWRWLPTLAGLTFAVWLGKFLIGRILIGEFSVWSADAETWARYMLAVPGALLAGLALRLQVRQFMALGFPNLIPDLRNAGLALWIYAGVGGLLVPSGAFFPANVLNRDILLQWGIPPQVPRALCATAIAFYFVRLLRVFDHENRRRLEAAEGIRAAAMERERLGRDLHDGILQSLYAVGLGLQVAGTRLPSHPDDASRRIHETVARIDSLMGEIRSFIMGLDSGESQTRSLREQISAVISQFEATHGQPVAVCVEGAPPGPVSPEATEQATGIVREALSNAGRHARATRITVRLDLTPGGLNLSIQDDGRGFDVSSAMARSERQRHFGLRNLFRRAELAGGQLWLDSTLGKGTRVWTWLPYAQGGVEVERECAASNTHRR